MPLVPFPHWAPEVDSQTFAFLGRRMKDSSLGKFSQGKRPRNIDSCSPSPMRSQALFWSLYSNIRQSVKTSPIHRAFCQIFNASFLNMNGKEYHIMNKASNMKEWDLNQSEKWKLEETETIPGIKEDSKEIIINIHESINIIVHPWKKKNRI